MRFLNKHRLIRSFEGEMELQMAAIWPMAGCYCRVAIKRRGFVKFMPVLHSGYRLYRSRRWRLLPRCRERIIKYTLYDNRY